MGVIFFAFCVGPGTFRPPSTLTGEARIAENSAIYANVGYQFMSFNLMMVTAWSMVQIYEQYKKMTGNGVRYMELLDTLDEIEQQEQTQQTSRVVEGNLIEFKNVNIFTPTKNKLVHDLSFQVGERDSMLLTGHNGAGKSSVRS